MSTELDYNALRRLRYATDPDYRAAQIERSRRSRKPFSEWSEAQRARRLELKAMYRRKAGKPTREQMREQAEARKAEREATRASRLILHDAHVKEWKSDRNRIHKWKYKYVARYNLYHRIKRWMHKHLGNSLPSREWSQYLGYTTEELKQHLERQFKKGMNWENKGEWHIDHIVPVSSFNIESIDSPEFRACFGLANLRPIWADDNMIKGDRCIYLI